MKRKNHFNWSQIAEQIVRILGLIFRLAVILAPILKQLLKRYPL